ELLGRLPVISPLMPLTAETLVKILTEPKNALIKQYQHFFYMEDAQLEFTEKALYMLAQKAIKRDTGARALRSVLEELMLELMYELPDIKQKGGKYIIDSAAVEHGLPLEELREVVRKSA